MSIDTQDPAYGFGPQAPAVSWTEKRKPVPLQPPTEAVPQLLPMSAFAAAGGVPSSAKTFRS